MCEGVFPASNQVQLHQKNITLLRMKRYLTCWGTSRQRCVCVRRNTDQGASKLFISKPRTFFCFILQRKKLRWSNNNFCVFQQWLISKRRFLQEKKLKTFFSDSRFTFKSFVLNHVEMLIVEISWICNQHLPTFFFVSNYEYCKKYAWVPHIWVVAHYCI